MLLTARQERIFLSHVTVLDNDCWEWTSTISDSSYGRFNCVIGGVKKYRQAHRVAYEHWVGPIPDGAQLDHSCHTEAIALGQCAGGNDCQHRRCCNPAHMEPVTQRANLFRSSAAPAKINADKTHCPQGHPYDLANTYYPPTGGRACRACQRAHQRAYQLRKRGGAWGIDQALRTHCPQGHPYDEENTYQPPGRTSRMCRECLRLRARQRRAARKAA